MTAFLENRDIFNVIVSDWLTLKDLVNLDTAICSADLRDAFLSLLHAVPFQIPFADRIEDWWKNHQACLKWFAARKMCESRGQLNVHQKLWEKLLIQNSEADYRPFLQGIRNLRFLGFSGGFNFTGLNECSRLSGLHLCNLLTPQATSSGTASPFPPSLELLTLQNCMFDNELVRAFINCEKLKSMELYHVDFSSTVAADVALKIFGRIERIHVLGEVNAFQQLLQNGLTSFTNVYLDKAHKFEGGDVFNPRLLLLQSPNLRELTIARMRVDWHSLVKLIVRYRPSIDYLHLNHCRISENAHDVQSEELQVHWSRLKLSSLLFLNDELLISLLRLCKDKLNYLSLSFCAKLTNEGYESILKICPALTALEIDDVQERWDESRIRRISELFANIHNFRVVLWPSWYTEDQKQLHWSEREVRVERWRL